MKNLRLAKLTSPELAAAIETGTVVLLPVGSVEPHGPHLALETDTVISDAACLRACARLEEAGVHSLIAPPVPYGVTECASSFPGAVSIPGEVLTPFLAAVVGGYLNGGFRHVCLVNNHLEPAQDKAVRQSIQVFPPGLASVACPLTRRWARTLSTEFKTGACHAGRYESSIVMAADASLVREDLRSSLPEVPVSLSEKLGAGISDFREMGLDDAYAGSPAQASAAEGEELLERLAEMIVGEVLEALGA